MAKKRANKVEKQTRIPGTADPIPEEVQEAADEYVEAKREKAAWNESMNGRRERLIEVMINHGVHELDIDDGEKKLVLVDEHKLKIQAKKSSDTVAAEEAAFA